MINVLIVLTLFFLLSFPVKKIIEKEICSICLAVSATWITYLILFMLGKYNNAVILAILIGGSCVGLFYYFFSRVPKKYYLFKFPFIISLFWITYIVLLGVKRPVEEVVFVLSLWVIFTLIFLFSTKKGVKSFVTHLIECCKNW